MKRFSNSVSLLHLKDGIGLKSFVGKSAGAVGKVVTKSTGAVGKVVTKSTGRVGKVVTKRTKQKGQSLTVSDSPEKRGQEDQQNAEIGVDLFEAGKMRKHHGVGGSGSMGLDLGAFCRPGR